MHTPDGLRDLHARTHRNLADLIAHCRGLEAGALDRVLEGFGDGTVRLQIHHAIDAEKYWVGVIHGRIEADEDASPYPDLDALEAFRQEVFAFTDGYLAGVSPDALNTARDMTTWGGKVHSLVPAQIVLRTATHIYHHMGQLAAMCRLLGHPVSQGVNYPIVD
ncbi:MAG: DinB family protein [Candidatus Latescibacteria bacterium]|nr:DinB family protein [Candidatus Latescibacterota bacterium]